MAASLKLSVPDLLHFLRQPDWFLWTPTQRWRRLIATLLLKKCDSTGHHRLHGLPGDIRRWVVLPDLRALTYLCLNGLVSYNCKQAGIPADRQRFFFAGQRLRDDDLVKSGCISCFGARGPWVVERLIGMHEFPSEMHLDGKASMVEATVRNATLGTDGGGRCRVAPGVDK